MNSRSHPSRSLDGHLFLQIGQAGVYSSRRLCEFRRHVLHALDPFYVHACRVCGVAPEFLLVPNVHTDAGLSRCGCLSVCTDGCQNTETENEREACHRFHVTIPFAQRTKYARSRPQLCQGRPRPSHSQGPAVFSFARSTRAALRAGIQQATAAVSVSNTAAAERVGGSYVPLDYPKTIPIGPMEYPRQRLAVHLAQDGAVAVVELRPRPGTERTVSGIAQTAIACKSFVVAARLRRNRAPDVAASRCALPTV